MISLKSTSNNTFWNNSNRNNFSKFGCSKNQTAICNSAKFNSRRNFCISDFDNLFLLPKCAFASDKKMNLRRDLATYNFHINIVADTPRGNVWICK